MSAAAASRQEIAPFVSLPAGILEAFQPGRSFLLTAHSRPDGDAVGSLLALAELLEQCGCRPHIILADPVPAVFRALPGADRIRTGLPPGLTPLDVPVAIILECDSHARTGLDRIPSPFTINIDHHSSGRPFADLNWIDPAAPAVGSMIYQLACAAGADISESMAVCLYTAIVSDTGAFTSPATTPETMQVVADLAKRGADPATIAVGLYHSCPEERVRLLGSSLTNLQRRGAVAWSWVTLDDLDRLDATADDCEGVVNHLIGISGVEAAFFLRELPGNGSFRLSLRSKSRVDVSLVAESFGGGGHRISSGCTLTGTLDSVIGRVLHKVQTEL